jgi:type I restriction enzyme M protein
VDIKVLNAEIERIVQRSGELRTAIDAIIAEIEGTV